MPVIPLWVRILVLVGCILLLVGALKGCHDSLVDKGVQQEQGAQAARDRDQLKANERESMRRLAAQEASNRESANRLAAAAAAVRRERASGDKLRDELAASDLERRAADPALVAQCAAAEATVDLRTGLFGRADETAGELAAYADQARIAGQQCERDYDALSGGKP
jgi:hypothetical protein